MSLIGVTECHNDSYIVKFVPIIKSVISVSEFVIHLYIKEEKN